MQNQKTIPVAQGYFDEKGYLRVKKEFAYISEQELNEIDKNLSEYLLKIECTESRSYDNSDDDRVESSSSSYDFVRYGEINAKENSKSLLFMDNQLKGVVFYITPKSGYEIERNAFYFDGSVQHRMMLGYSASHSSSYTYVNKVTLVKKSVNGVPSSGINTRFNQHEMYPSF